VSEENVALVHRIYEAFNDRDVSAIPDLFDERVEIRLNVVMGPYRGRDGIGRYLADLMEDFPDLRVTVEETVDAGDQVVVVLSEQGKGRSSHVPVTVLQAHVWTVRDGKAVRGDAYRSRAGALAAVSLPA
jgi:ketosteroid isomerase-like protein